MPSTLEVIQHLDEFKFRLLDETSLQAAIASVFKSGGFSFEREVSLSPKDRIDFMLGTLGIEVKTKGSADKLAWQIQRYCESPQIGELLVLVTKPKLMALPARLNSKSISVYLLRTS